MPPSPPPQAVSDIDTAGAERRGQGAASKGGVSSGTQRRPQLSPTNMLPSNAAAPELRSIRPGRSRLGDGERLDA